MMMLIFLVKETLKKLFILNMTAVLNILEKMTLQKFLVKDSRVMGISVILNVWIF